MLRDSTTSAMASLDSIMPPSTDCSAGRSCGGCRSNVAGAEDRTGAPGQRSSTTTIAEPPSVDMCSVLDPGTDTAHSPITDGERDGLAWNLAAPLSMDANGTLGRSRG